MAICIKKTAGKCNQTADINKNGKKICEITQNGKCKQKAALLK